MPKMMEWPEIEFFNKLFSSLAMIVIPFVVVNIILYAITNGKDITNILAHKIISVIIIIWELFIITIIMHHFHISFMIFTPFIVTFKSMMGYGFSEQLSHNEKNIKFGNAERYCQVSFANYFCSHLIND